MGQTGYLWNGKTLHVFTRYIIRNKLIAIELRDNSKNP